MKRGVQLLFRALGLFFVGLGFAGVLLPLLPTTPFLLLALWLFAKGSPGLRRWLLTNRFCGRYLNDYYSGRGIPVRVKAYTLALLWAAILYSALCVADASWVKITLFTVAAGVSVHIIRFKTKRKYDELQQTDNSGSDGGGGGLPEK